MKIYKKFKLQQNKKLIVQDKELDKIIELINNSKWVFSNFESEIINAKEFSQINEWIGGNHDFILKYNAKRDGCNAEIFHQKCDNLKGSLIICKPINNDIIGGYISTKILKEDKFYDDKNAFLFNLTKNFVRKNKKSYTNAIKNFNDSSNLIRFGNGCPVFILSASCIIDNKSMVTSCTCNNTNYDCQNKNIFDTSGGVSFQVENLEVFEVN